MARLKVYLNNSLVKEYPLDPGQEYLVGRADHCQIVLNPERGISREHFAIRSKDGQWVLSGLSRFGELYYNGDKIHEMHLRDLDVFEVPPYKFEFKETEATRAQGLIHINELDNSDSFEKTVIGQNPLVAYLKVFDHHGKNVLTFQLDGTHWVAGRETSCALFIDNSKISRQQFEISLQDEVYSIRDLGSSNGTLLNGESLPTEHWTNITSGDVITVADWTCHFEVLDPNFNQRLKEIPSDLPMIYSGMDSVGNEHNNDHEQVNTFHQNSLQMYVPGQLQQPNLAMDGNYPYANQNNPYVQGMYYPPPATKKINRTLYFRLGIVVLVLGALYFYMDGESPAPKAKDAKSLANLSPFQRLSKNQQELAKHSLRLADRLYKEGNFELAKQEIAKIHEMLPDGFENSKEIEALAQTALKAMIDLKEQERLEKEQIEIKEKVKNQIAICRGKIHPNIQPVDMEECLAPVTPLDPNNSDIQSLKLKVEQIVADRNAQKVQKEEYQEKVRKHKVIYQRAEKIHQDGKYLAAINAYQDVLGSSLPDPDDLKGKSKRQISSIKEMLSDKQSTYEKQADGFVSKSDYKNAIITLKKAIEINPENEAIPARINSMIKELSKQMQIIYQESILEEGVGEVESAKVKWKKILEISIPEEEYYKKARIKLKKYGVIL